MGEPLVIVAKNLGFGEFSALSSEMGIFDFKCVKVILGRLIFSKSNFGSSYIGSY